MMSGIEDKKREVTDDMFADVHISCMAGYASAGLECVSPREGGDSFVGGGGCDDIGMVTVAQQY